MAQSHSQHGETRSTPYLILSVTVLILASIHVSLVCYSSEGIILFDIPNCSMRLGLACPFYRCETEAKREEVASLNHSE